MKVPLSNNAQRNREAGVALIITLILLSVITFMAVTFLVVSRGQKSSVGTYTDMAIAREAANAAVERVKAEVIATMMASTNPGNIDLLVSTNFINPYGFIRDLNAFTNVSYTYSDGTPVRGAHLLQNLTNLLFNPRVPVFITNRYTGSNEFRYYLDLNRNGRFETNGFQAVMNPGGGFYDTNFNRISQPALGQTVSNFFVGDPEWIGRLERSDLPHSSSNRFVYRYAYLAVPSGKTLDLNYSFNDAGGSGDLSIADPSRFQRDQGVGTWEVNLAAFLTDLNTNLWPARVGNMFGIPYQYAQFGNVMEGRGAAFEDAFNLLAYRYDFRRQNLLSVEQLYGTLGGNAFVTDFINGYSLLPVTTNSIRFIRETDNPVLPWSGSDTPNQFFSPQDLHDRTKVARLLPISQVALPDRLRFASTNLDSYNRYTFYRLLSQLGTDVSGEGPTDKINLNYDNQVRSNAFTKSVSSTNFLPWIPNDFFRVTANKLLSNAGYDPQVVNVENIQLYPTNFYTPHVHQMLQLAANIYDATTNRVLLQAPGRDLGAPTVFRPLFARSNNVVYIRGYTEVTNAAQVLNAPEWHDLTMTNFGTVDAFDMVYGVPLVVGAKKGFPNFNELGMQTAIQISRKLEFRRQNAGGPVVQTNVMYTLSISNLVGVEAWNSYSNAYPRELQARLSLDMFATLTNEFGQVLLPTVLNPNPVLRTAITNFSANSWRGYDNPTYAQDSFRMPLSAAAGDFYFLSNSIYLSSPPQFVPIHNRPFEFLTGANAFPAPRWYLNLRTRMRYIMLDVSSGTNIVDYVNLDSVEQPLDLSYILSMDGDCRGVIPSGTVEEGVMWCTNRMGGLGTPTVGMLNQIGASLGFTEPPRWNTDQHMSRENAIDFFRAQFDLSPITYSGTQFSKTNVFYSPYVATRTVYYSTEWQANDPLVHYTLGDLRDLFDNFQTNRIQFARDLSTNNIGRINKRFEPWGGGIAMSASPTAFDLAVKDPMVTRSDEWDFPTNKFPNVGLLGRVHRGTPWQTINLKGDATNLMLHPQTWYQPVQMVKWAKWCGNGVLTRNVGQYDTNVVPWNYITNDAAFTHPVNDRYILDLFTAAINENATRGQLSVNQTNLAAWSAVLSAVNVMPNSGSNMFIEPAGAYDPRNPSGIARIVAGIQGTMTNYPGGMFHRLGDVLATPELTVASPFLRSNLRPANPLAARDMTDAVYERIPQQVLGLLKGPDQPRIVVYAYGQALKPADRSLFNQAGPFFGVVTNYQVTAEAATRTVLRVEGVPRYPSPLTPQRPLNNLRVVVESFNLLPPD